MSAYPSMPPKATGNNPADLIKKKNDLRGQLTQPKQTGLIARIAHFFNVLFGKELSDREQAAVDSYKCNLYVDRMDLTPDQYLQNLRVDGIQPSDLLKAKLVEIHEERSEFDQKIAHMFAKSAISDDNGHAKETYDRAERIYNFNMMMVNPNLAHDINNAIILIESKEYVEDFESDIEDAKEAVSEMEVNLAEVQFGKDTVINGLEFAKGLTKTAVKKLEDNEVNKDKIRTKANTVRNEAFANYKLLLSFKEKIELNHSEISELVEEARENLESAKNLVGNPEDMPHIQEAKKNLEKLEDLLTKSQEIKDQVSEEFVNVTNAYQEIPNSWRLKFENAKERVDATVQSFVHGTPGQVLGATAKGTMTVGGHAARATWTTAMFLGGVVSTLLSLRGAEDDLSDAETEAEDESPAAATSTSTTTTSPPTPVIEKEEPQYDKKEYLRIQKKGKSSRTEEDKAYLNNFKDAHKAHLAAKKKK